MSALATSNHHRTTTQLLDVREHATELPHSNRSLTIGIVAPPWVPVPPPAYGGIEQVVDVLARGLLARGQRVRLFTVGSSTCPVEREWVLSEPPERIGDDLAGLTHAVAAHQALASCE